MCNARLWLLDYFVLLSFLLTLCLLFFFLKRGIRKTEYGIRIIIRISSKTKVRTRTTISTIRHHQRTYKARATFLRTDSSRIITAIKLRCVRRKEQSVLNLVDHSTSHDDLDDGNVLVGKMSKLSSVIPQAPTLCCSSNCLFSLETILLNPDGDISTHTAIKILNSISRSFLDNHISSSSIFSS